MAELGPPVLAAPWWGLKGQMRATLEAYQQGRCAVCGEAAPINFDHCHDAGLVRGLLCRRCNPAEGRDRRWDARLVAYRLRPPAVLLGATVPYCRELVRQSFCSAVEIGGPCQLDFRPRQPAQAAQYLAEHAAASCLDAWKRAHGPWQGMGRVPRGLLHAWFDAPKTTVTGWISKRASNHFPYPGDDRLYDEQALRRWGAQNGLLDDHGLPRTSYRRRPGG